VVNLAIPVPPLPSAVVHWDPEAIGKALIKVLLERKRSNCRGHVASLSQENIARNVVDVYR
jgi:hypothetical protein